MTYTHHTATLKAMLWHREKGIAEGRFLGRTLEIVHQERAALQTAISILEGNVVPGAEGAMVDHHEAMHADCVWDWTGIANYLGAPDIIAEPPPEDSWPVEKNKGGGFVKKEEV